MILQILLFSLKRHSYMDLQIFYQGVAYILRTEMLVLFDRYGGNEREHKTLTTHSLTNFRFIHRISEESLDVGQLQNLKRPDS